MAWTLAETIIYITWAIGGLAIIGAVIYKLYQKRKEKKREDAVPKPPF